jgi:hypothetical protein
MTFDLQAKCTERIGAFRGAMCSRLKEAQQERQQQNLKLKDAQQQQQQQNLKLKEAQQERQQQNLRLMSVERDLRQQEIRAKQADFQIEVLRKANRSLEDQNRRQEQELERADKEFNEADTEASGQIEALQKANRSQCQAIDEQEEALERADKLYYSHRWLEEQNRRLEQELHSSSEATKPGTATAGDVADAVQRNHSKEWWEQLVRELRDCKAVVVLVGQDGQVGHFPILFSFHFADIRGAGARGAVRGVSRYDMEPREGGRKGRGHRTAPHVRGLPIAGSRPHPCADAGDPQLSSPKNLLV